MTLPTSLPPYFWPVLLLAFLAYVLWPRRRYFPGPPIVGVFGVFLTTGRQLKRRHLHQRELRDKYGPVIQINRGTQTALMLTAPSDVKFLVENRELFPDRPPLKGFQVLTPNGLLGLDVQDARGRWAAHRRLLSPLFAEKLMRAYASTIAAQGDKLVAVLRDAKARPIDMVPLMSALALDAIGLCGFDTDFGAVEGVDDAGHFSRKFTSSATEALDVVVRLSLLPWWITAVDFRRWGDEERTRTPFQEILSRLRREFYAAESSARGAADSKTMLSELLQSEARGELTSEEVDDEMRTMLFAGFDTTAHTMSWTLYELARNPDVQERLRALPTEAERVAYAKLCALEGLRHHCTVPATPRVSSAPFTLRGVELPANTLVVVAFNALNFGEHWGADVHQFVPERHRGERPAHEFMPFGFGTRVCIGKRFALLEAETVLAKLVTHFRVKLVPGADAPQDALTVTLAPKGLKLIFEPL